MNFTFDLNTKYVARYRYVEYIAKTSPRGLYLH
jgi:hypothetical protein